MGSKSGAITLHYPSNSGKGVLALTASFHSSLIPDIQKISQLKSSLLKTAEKVDTGMRISSEKYLKKKAPESKFERLQSIVNS